MKISCKCLNVIIESNGSTIDEVDVSTLDIPKNDFFNEGVGTVELVGISKEQSVLVEVHSVGSWVIHRCLNCEMYTHALNRDKGAASLLVNKSLITDPDIIAELKKSENFSPVFHIVINYTDDDDVFTKVSGTGRHQAGIVALHQALTSFIQRESALTEERVRSYTDQQYAALENLRSRAHRDHRSLTKLLNETGYDGNISSASTRTVTDSSNVNPNNINFITSSNNNRVVLAAASAAMNKPIIVPSTNKPKIAQNNTSTGDAVNSNPINKSDVINVSGRAGRSNNRRLSETGSQSNLSFDSEVLFPLEGMEDPASDNYHTDEERSDSDDSGSHDEGIHIPRGRVNSFVYAKSLPVNVPTFPQHTGGINYDGVSMIPGANGNDDFTSNADEPFSDHHRSPRQPMDIAASIKALAKSVHGDAVFGDLPRPRFSSQI